MKTWSKQDRLQATLLGEAVDRPPVALWRHWPGDDQRADDQAQAHLTFQQRYDWDFIKVTPCSSYCVADWGVESVYMGNTEGTREYRRHVIQNPGDWEKLPLLDPAAGSLGRQLRCLELIAEGVSGTVPFIQTIFNPLSAAKYLAGEERLRVHLRRYPEALLKGLETITESTLRFVQQVLQRGAAGLFFAVQHAQFGVFSAEEYRQFGRPFDLRILNAVADKSWLNLLHLHGSEVMFDLLADFPVQIINWHDRETPPTLAEGQNRFRGAVCGGLRQWETLVRGAPDDVRAEAQDAILQTGERRFILGTGCVTPIVAPTSNLRAARQAVEPRPCEGSPL
jgi:uroporphyrinogen decarboxylase